MLNKKLSPHTTNKILIVIQGILLFTCLLTGFRAMMLTGADQHPQQVSKIVVSWLAFVVFLVIDMYRHNRFPWIR